MICSDYGQLWIENTRSIVSALVDLPTANRCWAPSVWVEERACFLDQAKQGPPESRTQAGPAAPAGRTLAIDHCDLRGPSRAEVHSWKGSRPGVSAPAPRLLGCFSSLRPLDDSRVEGDDVYCFSGKLPAINFHFHFQKGKHQFQSVTNQKPLLGDTKPVKHDTIKLQLSRS